MGSTCSGVDEGNAFYIAVIPHSWLHPRHPDPDSKRRGDLQEVIEHDGGKRMVFFDFLSLFQVPREPDEHNVFSFALRGMHFVYANPGIAVYRLVSIPPQSSSSTPYFQRGWCHF